MNKNKIKKAVNKFKTDYGYDYMIEDTTLTLYGFAQINEYDGIILATRSLGCMDNGKEVCYYRVLDKIHYHHLNKLERLRDALNDNEYKNKMYHEKRTERVKDWFRRVHTEVYMRGLNN